MKVQHITITLIITIISFFHSEKVLGQQSITEVNKDFEKELRDEFNNGKAAGIQVSIIHGKKRHSYQLGYRDYSTNKKVDHSTLFKNASTGKVFVAFAALKLSLSGKLDLDKNISTYIDGLEPSIGRLTTRQLITHTAGLKDESDNFGPSGVSQQIQMSKELGKNKFFGKPGVVFSYSNTGYDIAGAVIEAVTKKDFNSAMKELVFNPLKMYTTTYRISSDGLKNVAYGHYGNSTNSSLPDNAKGRASGMAFTTADEMNRFIKWLHTEHTNKSDNLLKNKVLEIFSNKKMTGQYWEYGYGLFHSDYCRKSSIWHSGGIPGYKAAFLSVPDEDFSVVVLVNSSGLNQWNIVRKAVQTYLKGDCSPTKNKLNTVDISEQEINDLIGTYSQGIGARIRLFKKNNTLFLDVDGGKDYLVKKTKEGKIISTDNEKPINSYGVFKDKNGKVLYLQYWVRAYPKIK